MNKGEFLKGLRERLSGEIPEYQVQEHLRYYEQYLSEQIYLGKTEEEAVEMLGNPYLIAKTILDMEEQEESEEEAEEEQHSYHYKEEGQPQNHKTKEIKMYTWYSKLLFFAVVLLILILIFTIVGSLMAFVIRFMFPILIIGLVFYLFKKGTRGS